MNPDTPLTEVAHHLSRIGAEGLGHYPPNVQEATLTAIRVCVTHWESNGIVISSPLAYGEILSSISAVCAPAYQEVARLHAEVFSLRTQLEVAENLAKSLLDLEELADGS